MNKYFKAGRFASRNAILRARERERKTAPEPHNIRREGDEVACSCGARWPVGEDHP